jgi:hypothetical protein
MGANSSNTAGHWESTPICRFNDRMLESAGTDWSDWGAVNPGWFRSPVVESFLLEAIDVLNEEFGSSQLFVLKDPRICRLLPFWIEVFKRAGIDPKFAIPLRNPLEVAASLQKRNGFDVEVGQLLWLRHVLDAEYFSRGRRRFFCSFEQVLSAWPQVLETASSSFGIQWPRLSTASAIEIDQFLNPSLRHHNERPETFIAKADASLLAKTFRVLDRWAGDGERKSDFKELNHVRASLAQSAPIFERIVLSGRKSATEVRALTGAIADLQKNSARTEESYRLQIKQLSDQASRRENDLTAAEQQLAAISQEAKNIRNKLAETESALRQRRLEAEQTSAELATAKTALAEGANALAASRTENQSMLVALEHLKGQLEEAEQTRKELSSLKDTAREEVAKSTDRTQEIATLTAILRQSEDKMAVSETALNAVLRGLLQLLNKQPSRLLPRSLQIRQRARVLRESGLFDPDWYLAENEDVAKAGIDPLLHYVEFGANENRAPNAFLARLGTCNVFELQHPDKTKH